MERCPASENPLRRMEGMTFLCAPGRATQKGHAEGTADSRATGSRIPLLFDEGSKWVL